MTGRGWTLALTNLTKLAGLVIAINEALLRHQVRPIALAVASFMMAGAQVSENVIIAAIDRFVGGGKK